MPVVSPRLDRRLLQAAVRLDDPRESMAEIWRRVGALADELGLTRPGYDSIRLVVREHRRARDEVRRLLEPVLADYAQGRVSAWDVERLVRAGELYARGRQGGAGAL